MRRGIVVVDAVDKDNAVFAVLVGHLDHELEDLFGLEPVDGLVRVGVDEVVFFVFRDLAHEIFGDGDGDVEIIDLLVVLLADDEIHDVRMVDAQDTHVGAAPGAALLDRLGGGVKDFHERNGTRGDAARGTDGRRTRPQARERKSRAAARLVDERGELDGIENAVHRIFNRQDKTGGELGKVAARVHQGRGVRHELEAFHHLQELLLKGGDVLFGLAVEAVCGRNRFGHPGEHLLRGLNDLAVFVFFEVAFFEDSQRIVGKLKRHESSLLSLRVAG